MDAALVSGCALVGLLAGGVLDEVAARIPPAAPRAATAEAPAVPSVNGVPAPPITPSTPPITPRPLPAAPRPLERLGAAAVGALALGLAASRIGAHPALAAYCVLFAGLLAVSVADFRVGLVPRVLLYPTFGLMAVALLAASATDGPWHAFLDAGIAGAGAFLFFFAVWWFYPRGIGFGDVRLAGVIGAGLGWLGWGPLYVGFASAFLLGAVIGGAVMVQQGTGRKTRLAFGPPLAIGAVIGVLWGASFTHFFTAHP